MSWRALGIANLLTLSRFLMAIVAFLFALAGRPKSVALVILLFGVTDALDGRIARALGQASALGQKLDTFADAVGAFFLALGYYALYPIFVQERFPSLAGILILYLVFLSAYRFKYKVFGSWHTISSKTLATVIVIFVLHGLIWQPSPIGYIIMLTAVAIAAAENIALLVLLPKPREVVSIFQILGKEKQTKKKKRTRRGR